MENEKNSETSPWEIANKKLTVIDIDMQFFAKVVKSDLANLHKISGLLVNRAESNLKKSEGGRKFSPPRSL